MLERRSGVLLAAVVAACFPRGDVVPPAGEVAITHVTVVDVVGGRRLADRTVLVLSGRLRAIDSGSAPPVRQATQVIDGQGKFLIPGLWDMHVHTIRADIDFPLEIANGVTSVRDMGGTTDYPPPGNWGIRFDSLRTWRNAIRQGRLVGPRVIAGGVALDGPRPEWRQTLSLKSADDARRSVDSLRAAGVDFIKVYQAIPKAIYFAIADEARAVGLPFAGHLSDSLTLEEAAAAGQRSIEHASNERLDDAPAASAETLVRHGTWLDPTLTVFLPPTVLARVPSAGQLAYVPRNVRKVWSRGLRWLPSDAHRAAAYERFRTLVSVSHAKGVKILAGSDAWNPGVIPGAGLHDELSLLVDAGLSPMEALQAATIRSAEYAGVADSLGSLTPGKLADVVLLDADPIANVRNTRRVRAVITDGRLFDRDALDRLLSGARRGARSWRWH